MAVFYPANFDVARKLPCATLRAVLGINAFDEQA